MSLGSSGSGVSEHELSAIHKQTPKKLQFINTLHAALCNHYTLVELIIGWMRESGQISHLVYSDWSQKAIWEKNVCGNKSSGCVSRLDNMSATLDKNRKFLFFLHIFLPVRQ